MRRSLKRRRGNSHPTSFPFLVYLRGEKQKFGEKEKVVFQDGRVLQRERGRRGGKRKGKTRGPQMPRRQREPPASLVTRVVDWVFTMLRNAEFEILFFLFFVIAFLLFKDLVWWLYCLSLSSLPSLPIYGTFVVFLLDNCIVLVLRPICSGLLSLVFCGILR